MSQPAVSVVVPAYNHEAFVEEALVSVCRQTFGDWELVAVDDGSTDATAAAIERVAQTDGRIRLIRQTNAGSHGAIQRGLRACRGAWVALLNSDDRWAPTRLQRLMEVARDGARFVTTGVRLIDAHGAEVHDASHWWLRTQRDFVAHARALGPVEGLLYGNYTISTSNFFMERGLLDAVGGPRPLKMIPDWEWALRLSLADPTGVRFLMDEPLMDYRLHGGNAILQHTLRGDLEINRLHRQVLRQRGVPSGLIAAVFRNQRDLRQNWRRLGVEGVEAHLRARERDVAMLQAERDRADGFVRDREADVRQLQGEVEGLIETTRGLYQRIADLEGKLSATEERLLESEGYARAKRAENSVLHERLDDADRSPIRRVMRLLRRR